MSNRRWACVLALVFILCAVPAALLLTRRKPAPRAEILSGGEVIRVVSLSVDQSFTVPTETGYNVVTVAGGKIAVTDASCPDHYCIRRGFCNSGADIVCLPNALVIRFLGTTEEIDAVTG